MPLEESRSDGVWAGPIFLLKIVCLCMIPISFVIEAKELGQFPDGSQAAAFLYAWIFAAIHKCSRPAKLTRVHYQSELRDNPLDR